MRKLANSELNRLSVEEYKLISKLPYVMILDNVRSLNNVGSVFRTADAFRAEAVYLCGITACPPHREISKTALGATESVDWKYFKDTRDALMELKEKDYRILSLEQADESVMLFDWKFDVNQKVAVVVGNEVHGIQEEVLALSDACLEIPQAGTKHSVNVAVSAGIIAWELFCVYRKLMYQ